MKSPPRQVRAKRRPASPHGKGLDTRAIDEIYGLEPVFEPAAQDPAGGSEESHAVSGAARSQSVRCPYCGEPFETLLDLSAGSSSYVEDCQICCRPIEFRLEVDHDGALAKLELLRGD